MRRVDVRRGGEEVCLRPYVVSRHLPIGKNGKKDINSGIAAPTRGEAVVCGRGYLCLACGRDRCSFYDRLPTANIPGLGAGIQVSKVEADIPMGKAIVVTGVMV